MSSMPGLERTHEPTWNAGRQPVIPSSEYMRATGHKLVQLPGCKEDVKTS